MKIVNQHKAFSVMYHVIVDPGSLVKIPMDELKKLINDTIMSSEYWVLDVELGKYYTECLALFFTFKLAYALPLGSKPDRLETFTRLAEELEHTLINTLTELKDKIC